MIDPFASASGLVRFVGLIGLLLVMPLGCGPIQFTIGSRAADQRLVETTIARDAPRVRDKVAVIDVEGFLINAERPGFLQTGENPVAWLDDRLSRAAGDCNVRAVILRINSPGGTVTASEMMYRSITRFRETTGKPVVVLMMEVAASGGYYISAPADHIVAHPTTITGSIGVILQTISFQPGLERLGVITRTYRSGDAKDAGSPLARPRPEHDPIFQGLIDGFFHRFQETVDRHRTHIAVEHRETVYDGRILSGTEAVKLGLVDEIGDIEEAWHAAKRLAGVPRANLVLYHRQGRVPRRPYLPGQERYGFPPSVTGNGAAITSTSSQADGGPTRFQLNLMQINLDRLLNETDSGFHYLWLPGE
ncbi:MAG: signal peptide peptidase SppA [Phycisphaeraceae bacterium]|nr:signal peptide peptidase SppA [Phycisphaeraceae bacterium]